MSIVPKEAIEVAAQSMGLNNLSSEAAQCLAPDVEYRLREIMQEAIKCMRHSNRTFLAGGDVDTALGMRNVEPIYGFLSNSPMAFKRAAGYKDLFYIEDKEIELKDIIDAPLPKAPLDTSVVCHWLAIDGVQPAIPENIPVQVIPTFSQTKSFGQKDGKIPVDVNLPVRHVLSKELKFYFDKITELALGRSDTDLFKQALISLATDAGLHPLVPYFIAFIEDEVSRGLDNFNLLCALMRVVCSLLRNPYIHIECYLHKLMPSVVTCLVGKRLGSRFSDTHWVLRDFVATLIASVCKRPGNVYERVQMSLTRTFFKAFLNPEMSLTQHYGAIKGLTALGPNVVRQHLLPNIQYYMRFLRGEMALESHKNEMKRHEAWRVYGAFLDAAGSYIYTLLKTCPPAPICSPLPTTWRIDSKIVTSRTGEFHIRGRRETAAAGFSNAIQQNCEGEGEEKESCMKKKKKGEERGRRLGREALEKLVWKEEVGSGKVLMILLEEFGESIFPFIPLPHLSIFL